VINPAHARSLAALGDYEKAIAADPKDADLYLEYAESLLGKEIGPLAEADPPSPEDAAKFRKVRELAQKAVDLGGDPGRAYGDLGTTYMVEKDADLAAGISALEKSRALLPGRLDYGVHLFTMYRRVGNRAKADPLFIELDRARNPQVAYAMRATIMRI
jgi:tetratricopeptide (TPR) repeat protein